MTGYRTHTANTSTTATGDNWRHRAVCRDENPELFFPPGNTGLSLLQIEEAKTVCRRCPVVTECLKWALGTRQEAGVWGGVSEDERRALLRGRHHIGDPAVREAVRTVRVDHGIRTERIRTLAGAGHNDTEIAHELGGNWTPKRVREARRNAEPPILAGRYAHGTPRRVA